MKKLIFFYASCILLFFVFKVVLLAQENNLDLKQSTSSEDSVESKILDKVQRSDTQSGKKFDQKKKVVTEKTAFDFDEAVLEGKVKTPNVLILRGRSKQPKSQMIQLRTSFRDEIYKSKPSIRGIK